MFTLEDIDEVAEVGMWPIGIPWAIEGDLLDLKTVLVDSRPVDERNYSKDEGTEQYIGP